MQIKRENKEEKTKNFKMENLFVVLFCFGLVFQFKFYSRYLLNELLMENFPINNRLNSYDH